MNSCPICHTPHIQPIDAGSEFGDRHWYYCNSCKLYFLSDIPSPYELRKYYEDSYFSVQRESGFAYRLRAWFSRMRAESQYAYIESHRISDTKHVLEVGSSDGSLLAVFKRRGWTVTGLEFSEFGRKKAFERHGIKLLPCDITDLSPRDCMYDCIVFSHVLEHMTEPDAILEHSRSLLTPKGQIFIELPHSPLPGEIDEGLLNLYLNTTHIYNFRPFSLTSLVKSAQLSLLDLSRFFYFVPRFQWDRAPLFGSMLMRSTLDTRNPIDIAHAMAFLACLQMRDLAGKNIMMPVDIHEPWIGFGDNIRLVAGI